MPEKYTAELAKKKIAFWEGMLTQKVEGKNGPIIY
jgi:hypothetical protein